MHVFKRLDRMPVYLQGLTTGGHTWAHHGGLPVFCQWSGSGPVSGWRETSHHAHRRSERQREACINPTDRGPYITAYQKLRSYSTSYESSNTSKETFKTQLI